MVFDVATSPMSLAFWRPFELYLADHGATVGKGVAAHRVYKRDSGGYRVEHDGGRSDCDLLVLALDVGALKQLVASSPELPEPLARAVADLQVTRPFGVLRLWLDRTLAPERPAFAGTNGVGELDSIAVYERFQDESEAWSRHHDGSVVELHGYALRSDDPAAIRSDLLAGLHALYPESQRARIVDERFQLRQDCPAFPPGSYAHRPSPDIGVPDLTLAGDFVRMPFPCALMERAAASGVLAANLLLAGLDVAPHPIHSVPNHGLLAPIRASRSHAPGITHAGNTPANNSRGALWCVGRKLPHAPMREARPDWEQADPAWIRGALRHAQELPSGGWYVIAPSAAFGERPQCSEIAGRSLVAWRVGDRLLAAPCTCPHMGASLADAHIREGHLICPWHGLALGPEGHNAWHSLPTYDDGRLLWVRLEQAGETPCATPYLTERANPIDLRRGLHRNRLRQPRRDRQPLGSVARRALPPARIRSAAHDRSARRPDHGSRRVSRRRPARDRSRRTLPVLRSAHDRDDDHARRRRRQRGRNPRHPDRPRSHARDRSGVRHLRSPRLQNRTAARSAAAAVDRAAGAQTLAGGRTLRRTTVHVAASPPCRQRQGRRAVPAPGYTLGLSLIPASRERPST